MKELKLYTGIPINLKFFKSKNVYRRVPGQPINTIAAQQPAITAPDLLPAMEGEAYMPPGQSLTEKYWQ